MEKKDASNCYHHEYWRANPSGEIYAVQLDSDQIVGVCRPLPHQIYESRAAENYEFESNPDSEELCAFREGAESEPNAFAIYEPEA